MNEPAASLGDALSAGLRLSWMKMRPPASNTANPIGVCPSGRCSAPSLHSWNPVTRQVPRRSWAVGMIGSVRCESGVLLYLLPFRIERCDRLRRRAQSDHQSGGGDHQHAADGLEVRRFMKNDDAEQSRKNQIA